MIRNITKPETLTIRTFIYILEKCENMHMYICTNFPKNMHKITKNQCLPSFESQYPFVALLLLICE